MQKQNFMCGIFNKIPAKGWFLIKLGFLLAAILLCGSLDTSAQNKRAGKGKVNKIKGHKIEDQKDTKETKKEDEIITRENFPVSVVNSVDTDYLSGEANVAVNPKQPTVVRLGLAQNAVSVVEFPAADGVYYIHEGNPKLVSVFQSPTRVTDRSITVYPGEGFLVGNKDASATITLQMRSGLILILEFVPVGNIRQNAHRCVISYDREEVVSARRSVGLAYDLGEDNKQPNTKNVRANSKLVTETAEEPTEKIEEISKKEEIIPVNLTETEVIRGKPGRRENENQQKTAKTGLELSRLVNKKLADCLKDPNKGVGAWSSSRNGLSLAVSPVSEIDSSQRLVIVAVRNNSTSNLRLVPGTPELQVLTSDEKGNPLNAERLERTYVETTSLEGLILPGSVSYYALVYNAPVLGAGQRLSVLVSHREAADTPANVFLSGVKAGKE